MIEEKKEGYYVITHNIDEETKIVCKYKMIKFKSEKTFKSFTKLCRYKTKRKIAILVNGESFYEAVRNLFEHMVIWYPNYDEDMAANRGVRVIPETLRLKAAYQKIRDLFLNVEQ
jgi:hypothetical protein